MPIRLLYFPPAETARRFLDISHAVRLYEIVGAVGSSAASKGEANHHEGSHSTPPPTQRNVSMFSDDLVNLLGESKIQTNIDTQKVPSGGASVAADPEHSESASSLTLIKSTYDSDLLTLHQTISQWVVHIVTDSSDASSPPKKALVKNLACLCNFFGHYGVMKFVLPQILTFLNDKSDWQLRAALCQHLPSACAVVGRAATELIVIPCIETALVDEEDSVISCALLCLKSLVEMGLVTRATLLGPHCLPSSEEGGLGTIEKCAPLILHYCHGIRHSAISFIHGAWKSLGFPDNEVFLLPLLRPFFRYDPSPDEFKVRMMLDYYVVTVCSHSNNSSCNSNQQESTQLLIPSPL